MSDSVEQNDAEHEAIEEAGLELDAQDSHSDDDQHTDDSASPPLAESSREDQGGMEAAEVQSDGWQNALQEAGFQSFDDVDYAVRALVDANKQRDQQISMYADQLKFYQEQMRNRDLAPQSSPEPEPVNQETDPIDSLIDGWQDPSWAHQYIEIDEEGNRVISDHADEETRQRIMEMDRGLRKWQEVLQDPRQLANAIDRRVERMIQEKFEASYNQKQTQATEQATVDSFVNNNADWLYQRDPATGQYIVDPVTNNYVYSDSGVKFTQHMDSLRAKGVSSIKDQIEMASMMMGGATPQQSQPAQQQSTQQTIDEQRKAMRGRTNNTRTRQTSFNGVSPDSGSGVTGEQQLSFGELTLAAMKEGVE